MKKFIITTKAGSFTAWFTERGLARLHFPDSAASSENADQPVSPEFKEWLGTTAAAIESALAGKDPKVLPPLDLSAGTPFQRSVWNALRKIPAGQTRSYSDIALAIGSERAARAVGGVCGENPIPLLIPCHRVLRKGGKLGGFSGGLEWKRRLLGVEGIHTKD
jgi:O-6-methylguanine DNA methyltransferase